MYSGLYIAHLKPACSKEKPKSLVVHFVVHPNVVYYHSPKAMAMYYKLYLGEWLVYIPSELQVHCSPQLLLWASIEVANWINVYVFRGLIGYHT